MTDTPTDTPHPTAEELAKAGQVSAAAAEAVQTSTSVEEAREKGAAAVKREAERVQLEISDEDCTKIVDMMIDRLNELGAFEPSPPAAAPPAGPTPEQVAATAAAAEAAQPAPRKRTFAEKFAGL